LTIGFLAVDAALLQPEPVAASDACWRRRLSPVSADPRTTSRAERRSFNAIST